MTDNIAIHSNSSLPRHEVPVSPHTQKEPAGFWGKVGNMFTQPAQACWKWGRYMVSPFPEPTAALQKISDLAENGIKKARETLVKIEPMEGSFETHLNRSLNPDPPVEMNRESLDWKEQIKTHSRTLCRQLSIYNALEKMRDACGIKAEEEFHVLALVKQATEGNHPPSVWKLFIGKYKQLTFFQKIKAGWVYWVYYQTSLISNTVEAYVEAFIRNMTSDLTSAKTRSYVFSKLLENASQFLIDDVQATKNFADGKEYGNVDDYRARAIQRHYAPLSIKELCKKCSENRIKKDAPTVRFFKDFQQIPFLGWFFQGFEWLVNRYIIQRSMRRSILPKALEDLFDKGVSNHLSFALTLTRFFTSQIKELNTVLDSKKELSKPTTPPSGTELLPETIKYLKQAVDLEDCRTPDEVKERLQKLNGQGFFGFFNKKIDEVLEQGAIDAGNLLFQYLNEKTQSGELFARLLLELSSDPFSRNMASEEVLKAKYEAEQSELEGIGAIAFEKLTRKSVAKIIIRGNPKYKKEAAEQSFKAKQKVAEITFGQLKQLSNQMRGKIVASAELPTPENNVQTDIASFLQIMKVFVQRKETQDSFKTLNEAERDVAWRLITPLYERAAKMEEAVLRLQNLQDEYPCHVKIVGELQQIHDRLTSIRNQFHQYPDQPLDDSVIQSLGIPAEEIAKQLGAKAAHSKTLQSYVGEIAHLSESLTREQKALGALYALSSPLDQLFKYEQGEKQDGFQPKVCKTEIGEALKLFPKDERDSLFSLIGNGSNLKAKWGQLRQLLHRIDHTHRALKKGVENDLDGALDKTLEWVGKELNEYTDKKKEEHADMQSEINTISEEAAALEKEFTKAKLELPALFTPMETKMGAALGFGIGTLLGSSVAGPVGAAVGAGVGTAAGKYLYYAGTEEDSDFLHNDHGTVVKTALAGGAGVVAAACNCPLIGTAGTTYAGWNALKALHSWAYRKLYRKIWGEGGKGEEEDMKKKGILKKAYKFSLHPRVREGTLTRLLETMSESSRSG